MSTTITFNFSDYNTASADNDGYRIYRSEIVDPCPGGIAVVANEIHESTLNSGENLNIVYTDTSTIEDRLYVYRISLYRNSDNSEIMSAALGPFLSETSSNIGYPLAKIDENSVNYKLTRIPILWEDYSDGEKRLQYQWEEPFPISGAGNWNSTNTYSTGSYVRYQTTNTSNGYNGWEVYKASTDIAAGENAPDINSNWQEYTATSIDTTTGDFANFWYSYSPSNNTYYSRNTSLGLEGHFGLPAKNKTLGAHLLPHLKGINLVPFYQNPNFTITSKSYAYFGDSPQIVCDFAPSQNANTSSIFFDEGFTFISLFADIREDRYRKQADGILYAIEMFNSNGLGPGSFMSKNQNLADYTYFNLSSLLFSDSTPTVALNPWLKKQEDQIQAGSLTRSDEYPGLPRTLSEYTVRDYHLYNRSKGIGAYQMRSGYNTTNNYGLNSGGGWSSGNKNFRAGVTSPNGYLGNVLKPDGSGYGPNSISKTKLHTLVITEKHGLVKTFINGHLAYTNESDMDPLRGCLLNTNTVNNNYLSAASIESYCPQWHDAGITNPRVPYPGFHVMGNNIDGQFNFTHNYYNMNEVAITFMAHSAPIEDVLNFIGYYQNHQEIGPHIEVQQSYIGF